MTKEMVIQNKKILVMSRFPEEDIHTYQIELGYRLRSRMVCHRSPELTITTYEEDPEGRAFEEIHREVLGLLERNFVGSATHYIDPVSEDYVVLVLSSLHPLEKIREILGELSEVVWVGRDYPLITNSADSYENNLLRSRIRESKNHFCRVALQTKNNFFV